MLLIAKTVLGLVALYIAICIFGYWGQRALVYHPDRQRITPARAGLTGVEERVLKTPDGERLVAWYGKAKPGQPTLLYFHGNGGGLVDRVPRIERFMEAGYGIFMMAYRGYSGSSGAPTEAANVADAKLAFDTLVADGVPVQRIILYGESLGTGVATQVAVARPAGGLILDAPYTSIADVGAASYPFLPVRLVLVDRYDTQRYIRDVHMPLLILNGEKDNVIPPVMGRKLYELANEPKRLVTFPNGGHSDLYINGNTALDSVRAWIAHLPK
ncbi:MAG TPA: alpha/beta hydrolase [Hyphomicrobiaceae bacterium]|nr:alpha/beta hydrolase [Hyphomicrobiaceae bacterium]